MIEHAQTHTQHHSRFSKINSNANEHTERNNNNNNDNKNNKIFLKCINGDPNQSACVDEWN